MTIVNDNNLAYLLSLGFELDLCKQALTLNSTLENATEWILDPTHPPILSLSPTFELPNSSVSNTDRSTPYASASQPSSFSTRPDALKEAQEIKLAQKKKFENISNELKRDKMMEKEAKQRALVDIKEDREKRKLKAQPSSASKCSSSANLTERERIQLHLKEEKKLDQEQRRRILANIRNDQKDRKSRVSVSSSVGNTVSSSPQPKDKGQDAIIQLKLTNGSTVRQKFSASSKVIELIEFALTKERTVDNSVTLENLSLCCVYPRKNFTVNNGAMDMQEAGFLPNVSLNVLVALPVPAVQDHSDVSSMDQDDSEYSEESDELEDTMDSEHLRRSQLLSRLQRAGPPLLSRRQRAVGATTSGGHQLSDPSPVIEPQDIIMQETEAAKSNRRSSTLSAAEQRNHNAPVSIAPENTRVAKRRRDPKTLKKLCTTAVAVLLTQHTVSANRYLKKIVYVSTDVAEHLLSYLVTCGELNVSTLRKLADHCYLQHVILDSYDYCTDSLIEDLTKSNSSISIIKLSLRGCDVITDGAIRSLEGLKNLTYLDLNNCKVTDKGLKYIEKLQHLLYLNLSKTKITNVGILSMVTNAKFKPELQVLLLDGCTRVDSSGILIPIVNAFINLLQLSLGYTTFSKPLEQKLTNKNIRLEQLDVNHTLINDQDLIGFICQFKSLVELKLGGCEALTTRSLSFLPRELCRLKYIQFPDREHDLNDILSRYKDLPIEHLDLAGFLNITDEGAKYIAGMKHLRYLSLDGTKVTDEGIMLFENLTELEKLYLDRTLLTDVAIEKLKGLSKLETLSLCRTEVSNVGLCFLGDFEQISFARNLRTLNLAQCIHVTDKGVRGLDGMQNLTNLNLDHTGVSKSCLKYLKDLKNLNLVRLQGIEKEEDDTMDYE
ncbi:hypothetical protein BDF21DRAFT_489497 [Thamnidium elegans]|nr:hypothetical protein BDF21DRAFT_489497 [Thamnidium elegans]